MGYLFLAAALFTGATKGFCGKKTSAYIQGFKDSIIANFIRMLLCIAIGFVMASMQSGIRSLFIDSKTLFISILSGVSTAAFVILWLVCVKNGSYMVLDVFLTLGIIFTTVLCSITFGEEIRLNQYLGFVLLLVSTVIMCSYSNSSVSRMTIKSFLLLLFTGLANGLTGFSQKLFVYSGSQATSAVFNLYTYIFASVTMLLCMMLLKQESTTSGKNSIVLLIKSVIGYIVIMAICLFANSYFMTLAAGKLDSAMMYPLNSGAALILTSLMAVVFFKEKLTLKCIAGLILTFVSLLVINLL